MNVGNLKISVDYGDVDKAAQKIDDLGSNSKSAAGSLKTLESGMGSLLTAAGLVTVELIAMAGAAAIMAAIRFKDQIDDAADLGDRYGYTASQMLILKQAMEATGTSVEVYVAAQQKIANALAKSDDEGKAAAEAMKTLGVAVKDNTSPIQLLGDLTEKYSTKVKDGNVSVDEMASLQLVMGKNYREVMQAVTAASDAQKRYNDFQSLGIGITDASVKAASDNESAMLDLNVVTTAMGSKLVADIIPAFTVLTTAFVDSYKNGGLVAGAFRLIEIAAQVVMVPVRFLINTFIYLDTVITSVGKSIGALFAAIATQSTSPLSALRADIDALWTDAAKKMKEVELWSSADTTTTPGRTPSATPDKNPPKAPKEAKAKKESTKEYDEQVKLLEKLTGLFQKEEDALSKLKGVDIERVKLLRDAETIMGKIKGLTEAEKAATIDNVMARYDEVKALEKINKDKADTDKAAAQTAKALQHRLENLVSGTAIEKTKAFRQNIELLDNAMFDGEISTELHAQAIELLTGKMKDAKAPIAGLDFTARLVQTAFKGTEDALTTLVTTGKFSFASFASSIIADMARIVIQLKIIEPMMNAFKASMGAGGGGWASLGTSLIKAFSANGNAFDSTGILKSADGNVFDKPTLHGYSGGVGMLGEAGPEAILPLKRNSSGQLGVVAGGGGGMQQVNNITVNVQGGSTNEETGNSVSQSIVKVMQAVARSEIMTARRTGGALNPI